MDVELVSVIMPCYNDGQYITESIASVWAQTYPNIELVIINDGSDDNRTEAALEEIDDARLVKLHTPHLGPSGARNAGISKASGKFILPLDADDLIEPTYIEKAVNILERKPEVGIVYCKADKFGMESGEWILPAFSLPRILAENIIFVTSLFRKADWEKVGGFSCECVDGFEDYDFWLSLIEQGATAYQIPETLFHYRIKRISRSSQIEEHKQKRLEAYDLIVRRHKALYEENVTEVIKIYRWMLDEHTLVLNEMREHALVLNEMREHKTVADYLFRFVSRLGIIKKNLLEYVNSQSKFHSEKGVEVSEGNSGNKYEKSEKEKERNVDNDSAESRFR